MSTSFLSTLPFFPQCGQWNVVRSMQYLSSIVANVNQPLHEAQVKCHMISFTALNIVKVFSLPIFIPYHNSPFWVFVNKFTCFWQTIICVYDTSSFEIHNVVHYNPKIPNRLNQPIVVPIIIGVPIIINAIIKNARMAPLLSPASCLLVNKNLLIIFKGNH